MHSDGSDELEHFGVVGMKWGVRKARRQALAGAGSDEERKALKKQYNTADKTVKMMNKAARVNRKAAKASYKAAKNQYKNDSSRANKKIMKASKMSYKAAKKNKRAVRQQVKERYSNELNRR